MFAGRAHLLCDQQHHHHHTKTHTHAHKPLLTKIDIFDFYFECRCITYHLMSLFCFLSLLHLLLEDPIPREKEVALGSKHAIVFDSRLFNVKLSRNFQRCYRLI